jgi:hypothetical protein
MAEITAKTTADLHVGDAVLIRFGGYSNTVERHIITRETATRLMVQQGNAELTFVRATGRLMGSAGHTRTRLEPWRGTHQPLLDETEARNLRTWINYANLQAVPLETLREVKRLLTVEPTDG